MSAPVGNTCPDIDSVIKSVKSAMSLAGINGLETETELISVLGSIQDELYWCESTLEDLRKANETLRSWGEEQEERVYEAEETIVDMQKELEIMETA